MNMTANTNTNVHTNTNTHTNISTNANIIDIIQTLILVPAFARWFVYAKLPKRHIDLLLLANWSVTLSTQPREPEALRRSYEKVRGFDNHQPILTNSKQLRVTNLVFTSCAFHLL